jgi:4-hydroxy-tetrahydrodipicolinate synthase
MSRPPATAVPATSPEAEPLAAHGLWSPASVPVRADLAIDTGRAITHARHLLDTGCHGLAVFGTTSEANSFSLEERMGLLEDMLASGIPADRLMVGTGCCAVTDSVRLTDHAAGLGVKKVLMLPPFYYKGMSDAGLYRSFATVIERVADPDLRIFLYHFPRLSGVPITAGLIEMLLRDFPRTVVGLKDSSGDWENVRMLLDEFPGFAVFPGSESLLGRALEKGAAGCITATANVNTAGIRATYDALRAQAADGAAKDETMRAVRKALEAWPLVPALKHLIAHYRGDHAWRAVRPPMLPLPEEEGAKLVAAVEGAGLQPLV